MLIIRYCLVLSVVFGAGRAGFQNIELPAKATVIAMPPDTRKVQDANVIPRIFSYQGVLTDTFGIPVPDTVYQITFKLYTQPSGGTPFWTERQSVMISSGIFSTLLGVITPIPAIPDQGNLYLAMAIGEGAELSPRLRLVSVPYAWKADTANYALNSAGAAEQSWVRGTPDSVLYTEHLLGIARGKSDNMLWGTLRYTHTNLGIACTTGTSEEDCGYCSVGGGYANLASAEFATVAGGGSNRAIGSYATVAGGSGNSANASRATIGGGRFNLATGINSTIAGGKYNTATGYCSAVGGGVDNLASESYSSIMGGAGNAATGYCATVAAGANNIAAGRHAIVVGGSGNRAYGFGSLAAGNFARAHHNNCFVWSDSAPTEGDSVFSSGANQFRVRACGGVWFFSSVGMTSGVVLSPGSNSWSAISDSTMFGDCQPVDIENILKILLSLKVQEFSLRSQKNNARHIGPMAQEFYRLFGYGDTTGAVNLADMDGVLIAAIQALYRENQSLRQEMERIKAQIGEKR